MFDYRMVIFANVIINHQLGGPPLLTVTPAQAPFGSPFGSPAAWHRGLRGGKDLAEGLHQA